MVKLTTAEAMQKAIDKARAVKPMVRVVSFGSYIVTNKQTGATYAVTCEKRNGERFADCNCKAGARGLRCYPSRLPPARTSSWQQSASH
jgi:hypothetical protein